MKKHFTTKSKLTLIAAAAAITFASPALAKTIRHSQNDAAARQQLYNSTVVPPSGAQLQNPAYAPYANQVSGGWFVGGER
jgi:hypothetical protein